MRNHIYANEERQRFRNVFNKSPQFQSIKLETETFEQRHLQLMNEIKSQRLVST